MHPTIKVGIVDSLFIVHEGLKSIIERNEDVEISFQVLSSKELSSVLGASQPDVVIFDFDLNGGFRMNDLSRITSTWPNIGLVIFSSNRQARLIDQVLKYKPNCYLFKECDEDEILNSIRIAALDDRYYCKKVLRTILEKDKLVPLSSECSPTRLTAREIEVVANISQGLTAQQMADNLCLSVHTVYTHRKNIFKKMGVHSTAQLIRVAMDNELI